MHRIFLSLRAKIELQEVTGEIGAEIHRKIVAVRPTYDLKDPAGNPIGRLRKALLNVIHPKIWLEDPAGNKILEARGSFMRYDFVIYNMDGKTVAEINMLTRWKEFFAGGTIFDFSELYAIRVLDKSVDRRLILGFCMAIDNVFHDQGGAGGMAVGPFIIGRGPFFGPRRGPGAGPRGPHHFHPNHWGPF
ncbi:MAG TPA: hypothetical protein VKK79_23960, partial [Candidatus Lokiarchaeia archaeon]|nr:hypothetical protein [Candidatus Lokiarchaeia archaeon]